MDEPPSSAVVFRGAPVGARRAALHRFARVLRDLVADGHGFECLITNDAELQRLNREFLGRDYPADVLSFPADRSLRVAAPKRELGSLAISAERAAAQALEFGHSVEQEIEILMLHGLLHLLGMDHLTDRGQMARIEAEWRRRLDLPCGLIERAHR
jgi:probable rRNA maturation factor